MQAWVDPVYGETPATHAEAVEYINDPNHTFRTLQQAIDTLHQMMCENWDPIDNPDSKGIVWAAPGLYGPHGADSSDEPLPIRMRDRVHVQGLGASRCVIRGRRDADVDPSSGVVTHPDLFWPTTGPGSLFDAEVLVTFESAHSVSPAPWAPAGAPWASSTVASDTAEVFDSFTLQGGDVQVLVWDPELAGIPRAGRSGRISNCVFNLRSAWFPDKGGSGSVFGPYFGVMMLKPYVQPTAGQPGGYYDQQMLIAHNTFLFGRFARPDPSSPPTWVPGTARRPCVAVIDVTDPGCLGNGPKDPQSSLRGIGRAGLMANLFRTGPFSALAAGHLAMLGIDNKDTRFLAQFVPQGPFVEVQTNAFQPLAANQPSDGTLQYFSWPVTGAVVLASGPYGDLLNYHSQLPNGSCSGSQPPSGCPNCGDYPVNPPFAVWHSDAPGLDPCFVGEYLSDAYGSPLWNTHDLRLMPGSPCIDRGFPIPIASNGIPKPPREVSNVSGVTFDTAPTVCNSLLSGWDGEHWGNPRYFHSYVELGTKTDIGCDEAHLMVMAGSYANDSTVHNSNDPATHSGFNTLHPSVSNGFLERHLIFPKDAVSVGDLAGRDVTVFQKAQLVNYDANGNPVSFGWVNPPESLANPSYAAASSAPFPLRWKYILFDNFGPAEGMPGAWAFSLPQNPLSWFAPGGAPQIEFFDVPIQDSECNGGAIPPAPPLCYEAYFNSQAVLLESSGSPTVSPPVSSIRLRGNMQGEYR